VTEIDNERREPAAEPPPHASAEVGARVSAVLTAAEEAAATMRREAEADAERIVREAEERGRARLEELTGEPERLRAAAEADAARIRQEAEDAAVAERQRIEDERRQFERELQQRRDAALDELAAIEDERQKAVAKLQRGLGSLRGTSSQLEELIGALSPSGEAQPRRRGFGSLLARGEHESHAVYEALQQRVAAREAEVVADAEAAPAEAPKNGKRK
jgi:hypothetical protein